MFAHAENLEVKSEEPGAAELDVGKRARPEEEGASVDEEQDAKRSRPADLKAYLKKLLEEESKILPFASVLPECTRLLQQEIAQARLGKAVPSATGFVAASPKYTHVRRLHACVCVIHNTQLKAARSQQDRMLVSMRGHAVSIQNVTRACMCMHNYPLSRGQTLCRPSVHISAAMRFPYLRISKLR
jgi:hypothetical protein